jgi:hypothetical protein
LSEWTGGFAVDQLAPNTQLEFNHNAAAAHDWLYSCNDSNLPTPLS